MLAGRQSLATTFHKASALLEGDEAGAVGGAQAGPPVQGGLVGDGELGQVLANHLGLNLRSAVGEERSRGPWGEEGFGVV